MTTYSKSGSFGWAGGGKSGAIVDLWAAARVGGFPVENEAPPSGSPDAGPVTTGSIYGNPGGYLITGVPSIQDYYVRVQYGGQTFWGACPAATLGGQSGGGGSGWPTVDGSGPGNLVATTPSDDTVGYGMTDQGSGGILLQESGTGTFILQAAGTGDGASLTIQQTSVPDGGISITNDGSDGITIEDTQGGGISLTEDNASGQIVLSGAGIVNIQSGTGMVVQNDTSGTFEINQDADAALVIQTPNGGGIEIESGGTGALTLTSGAGGIALSTTGGGTITVNGVPLADTGWVNATSLLTSGWSVTGGGVCQYRKINGVVYVQANLTVGPGTNPVFTLPSGFLPGHTWDAAITADSTTAAPMEVHVSTAGAISIFNGSAVPASADFGFSYPADA